MTVYQIPHTRYSVQIATSDALRIRYDGRPIALLNSDGQLAMEVPMPSNGEDAGLYSEIMATIYSVSHTFSAHYKLAGEAA